MIPSTRALAVSIDVARAETNDRVRGTYVLVFRLARRRRIEIGNPKFGRRRKVSVGPLIVYTGSAQNGIAARIAQHRDPASRRYHHVRDIILAADFEFDAIARPGRPKDDECVMARLLGALPGAGIAKGVGNTDCARAGRRWCVGHVVSLPLDLLPRVRAVAARGL